MTRRSVSGPSAQRPDDVGGELLHAADLLRADDRDAAYDGLVADLRIAAETLDGA